MTAPGCQTDGMSVASGSSVDSAGSSESHRVAGPAGDALRPSRIRCPLRRAGPSAVTEPVAIDDDVVVDEDDDVGLGPSQPGVPRHRRRRPRLLHVTQPQFARKLRDQHPRECPAKAGRDRRRSPRSRRSRVQNRAQAALQRRASFRDVVTMTLDRGMRVLHRPTVSGSHSCRRRGSGATCAPR